MAPGRRGATGSSARVASKARESVAEPKLGCSGFVGLEFRVPHLRIGTLPAPEDHSDAGAEIGHEGLSCERLARNVFPSRKYRGPPRAHRVGYSSVRQSVPLFFIPLLQVLCTKQLLVPSIVVFAVEHPPISNKKIVKIIVGFTISPFILEGCCCF